MKLRVLVMAAVLLLGCEAPVNAPVSIKPIIEAGLVSPGAVRVDPNAVQVHIARALDSIEAQVEMTLRKVVQRVEGRAIARSGRDTEQTTTTVALEGSGWPLVAVAVAAVMAVGGIWWLRRKNKKLAGWTEAVTAGIKNLPPVHRTDVLNAIDGEVPDEVGFKRWLNARDLRATNHRTN